MTKLLKIAAAIVPLVVAQAAFGEIVGSKHDFSQATWSEGEICKPCHTPHNAIATNLSGRLWNHTLSTATYTLHGTNVNGVDPGVTGSQADMDRLSNLCLSCHDGTVALDSFGGATGSVMIGTVGDGRANLGTDLRNDHRVGIAAVYKEESGGAGHYRYRPIAAAKAAGLRFEVVPGTRTYTDQSGVLRENVANEAITCSTCHDVHNGAGETDGLLRFSNSASAVCLACHVK